MKKRSCSAHAVFPVHQDLGLQKYLLCVLPASCYCLSSFSFLSSALTLPVVGCACYLWCEGDLGRSALKESDYRRAQ